MYSLQACEPRIRFRGLSRNKTPCVSTGMDAMPARYRAGHGRGRARLCRRPVDSSVSRRGRDDSPRVSAGRFNLAGHLGASISPRAASIRLLSFEPAELPWPYYCENCGRAGNFPAVDYADEETCRLWSWDVIIHAFFSRGLSSCLSITRQDVPDYVSISLSRNKTPCVSTGMDTMPAWFRAGRGSGQAQLCRRPVSACISRLGRDDSPRVSVGRFNLAKVGLLPRSTCPRDNSVEIVGMPVS